MANAAQLEILKQGFEGWNRWRKDHIDEKIDLYGTDLREVHLFGAHLSGAHLSKADLRGATLNIANMRKAKLNRADLSRANLARNPFRVAIYMLGLLDRKTQGILAG